MLTGTELLAKVKELGDVSKSELVRECGYVSTKKDGGERLNFTAFYEALLEAKGLNLGGPSAPGQRGRSLSYVARVQFNGNLMVGKAYTAMMDLQPGDEFEIKLGKKQIRLIPIGEQHDDDDEMETMEPVDQEPMAVEQSATDPDDDSWEEEPIVEIPVVPTASASSKAEDDVFDENWQPA